VALTRLQSGGAGCSRQERGYVLLALLLIFALLAIGAAAVAPTIAFQIRRDREEELIHRGAQYSRAIKLYAKKTGRYPLSMQDLCPPGGVRYIRKLYKDPLTGGDFRPLHTADIMSITAPPNLNNAQTQSGDSQNAANSDANAANSPNQQSPSSPDSGGAGVSNPQPAPTIGTATLGTATLGAAIGNGNGSVPRSAPDDPTKGIIFGVVSTSKKQTIREFDHKNHYNQWLFFYDVNHDRGFLITGPTSLTPSAPTLVGQPIAGTAQQPGVPQPAAPQASPAQPSSTPQSTPQ
jgi:type II secretory pathway pseudopilin PulG